MNDTRSILKSLSKFGLVLFLILIVQLFLNKVMAQNKLSNAGEKLISNEIEIVPSTVGLSDTLKVGKNQNGLLKKIIQPIKFKDNRNTIEKERTYRFMQNLIQNGQLNIDPSKVDEIMKQLAKIISEKDSTEMVQKGSTKSDDLANQAISDKIDAILSKFDILKIRDKKLIDSVKIQMSSYIRANSPKF